MSENEKNGNSVVLKNGKFAGITPLKAIRFKCLECQAGSRKAVKNCETPACPLFSFKEGHNPNRKGIGRPGGNPLLSLSGTPLLNANSRL